MKKLPATENSLALRTDFADEAAWEMVAAAIQQPVGEFRAYVDLINDPDFAGLEAGQLETAALDDPNRSFVFLIDSLALSHPEHPILVVDLIDQPGRTFRVIPSEAWAIENNLSIGNMGFEEFADAAGPDGIFRGFPDA